MMATSSLNRRTEPLSDPRPRRRSGIASGAGYSLVELIVATGVMTLVMGATMAGLSDALKANDTVLMVTGMNGSIRAGMDLVVRDLLQVGSGLPPGHVILTPSGPDASLIKLPGPPGSSFTNSAGDTELAAVIPRPSRGPTINGVATDAITILTADNTFTDVGLTAVTSTSVDVVASVDIGSGPDRVTPGQLMMVTKGSATTLVQVTAVNASTRRITFAASDSLNLNQTTAGLDGNLAAVNAAAPANTPANTRITRVRMISYYLDATSPDHPRLVRRINNGNPTSFDNTLGTAVALDIENLQFTYDLNDGSTNPANVRFTTADLDGSGACAPDPCAANQVRKINILLTGRSSNAANPTARIYRNTLTSQVSLRGMAFVNEYQQP